MTDKIIEVIVDLRQGQGRTGLLNHLDMALITNWFRPRAGRYRITIERIPVSIEDETEES